VPLSSLTRERRCATSAFTFNQFGALHKKEYLATAFLLICDGFASGLGNPANRIDVFGRQTQASLKGLSNLKPRFCPSFPYRDFDSALAHGVLITESLFLALGNPNLPLS